MKNYFLNLTVSNWKNKRFFTGTLLFSIFPDYIKGNKNNLRKKRNHFCRRINDKSSSRS